MRAASGTPHARQRNKGLISMRLMYFEFTENINYCIAHIGTFK